QLENVERRGARRRLEVGAGTSPELQNFEGIVDDDAGRAVPLDDLAIGELLQAEERARLVGSSLLVVARSRRRAERKIEHRRSRDVAFEINLELAVHEREEIGRLPHGFRGAEDHESLWIQRIVEDAKHLLLQGGLHVDEDIAAADEIEPRERR